MNVELEQPTRGATERILSVFNDLYYNPGNEPEPGDLFEFLRDVSCYLAKNDLPV